MIDYEVIRSRVESGDTAEQIATWLNESGITNTPIRLTSLKWFLREQGLLYQGIQTPFVGPMADFTLVATGALQIGLLDFITHVFGDNNVLDTTDEVIAARGVGLLAALVGQGVLSSTQRDAFYTLGGGLAHVGVTAADVTASVNAHNAAVTRESLQLLLENAILAAQSSFATGGDKAQITSAFDGVMNG